MQSAHNKNNQAVACVQKERKLLPIKKLNTIITCYSLEYFDFFRTGFNTSFWIPNGGFLFFMICNLSKLLFTDGSFSVFFGCDIKFLQINKTIVNID